jgi:hypothetical protein
MLDHHREVLGDDLGGWIAAPILALAKGPVGDPLDAQFAIAGVEELAPRDRAMPVQDLDYPRPTDPISHPVLPPLRFPASTDLEALTTDNQEIRRSITLSSDAWLRIASPDRQKAVLSSEIDPMGGRAAPGLNITRRSLSRVREFDSCPGHQDRSWP